MKYTNIVILAGEWDTTPVVFNFLNKDFPISKVIVEAPVPRKEFLKKRIKKLGWITVAGQVLFQAIVSKALKRASGKRIEEILRQYKLERQIIPQEKIIPVPSANSDACLSALRNLRPDLVIVHGTRIISKKILTSIPAPFINIHAGITPRYRGSHGAYWALVNNDKENCGVTVHLVDTGIDTGNILAQELIPLSEKDNFVTYPYLQLAVGLNLLRNILHEELRPVENKHLTSALWHHPTLWGYCIRRLLNNVK
jgi:methionyl-tRNA formyltransferase